MNPRVWLYGALLLATAALGCKKLNANRCEAPSDCASNNCDPTTHYCVAANDGGTAGKGGAGGAGGMAGSMGGAAGGKAPFQCADALCPSGTPICDMDAGACEACATDDACKSLSATAPFCSPGTDGAAGPPKGTCVECRTSDDCKQSTLPICDPNTGTCESCAAQTTGDACKSRDPKTPVCVTASADGGAGPGAGSCVGCLTSANCAGTTPVCDAASNTCVRCVTDTDCHGIGGPGVCMTDGHCATDAETLYVLNDTASAKQTCSDTPGAASAGTTMQPFCSMEPLLPYVSKDRDLIVVDGSGQTIGGGTWSYANQAQPGELTLVGRSSAVIGGGSMPAFSMTTGSVSIRGVEFALSSIGIKATGGTLTLDTVKVDRCAGGIFIDGASFDIRNTTVTGNSTATDGLVSWSGIYVKSLTDAGASQLTLDSITNNANVGLLCSGPISGTGVLLSGNQGGNQMVSCGITSCVAGAGCGAPQ